MRKAIPFLLVLSLLIVSCTSTNDISHDAKFGNLLGRPITTKVPLKLYAIDYQLNSYSDRYELGSRVSGQPLIGVIPAGHSLLFDKAIRKNIPGASFEGLEGVIKYRGKLYPISYFLGLADRSGSDMWKGLHYDFLIP